MGLFAALLSSVFSSSKDLMSKRLAFHLDGTVSTFASFAFALPFYVVLLAVLFFLGRETLTVSLGFFILVLLRSTTDTLAEWMKMHAFGHGDLSMVVVVLSLSPLLLLVASPIITHDPLTLVEIVSVVLVVAGTILRVYQPSRRSWGGQKKGLLYAACGACFFSLNACFDRLAVQEGTPVFSGFTMTFLSALFLTPLIIGNKDRLSPCGCIAAASCFADCWRPPSWSASCQPCNTSMRRP